MFLTDTAGLMEQLRFQFIVAYFSWCRGEMIVERFRKQVAIDSKVLGSVGRCCGLWNKQLLVTVV